MSMTIPASVSSDGTRRTVWIPDGADDPENVTAAEIEAGTDLSYYLVDNSDGFNLDIPQDSIPDNRQGTSQNLSLPGRKNPSLTIQYGFNESSADDNAAKTALTEGTRGAFVHLLQVPEDYDPTTDGYYATYTYRYVPAKLGVQNIVPTATNAKDRISQGVFIDGAIVDGTVASSS